MCIRDRMKTRQVDAVIALDDYDAVSYTHLDVYKRQEFTQR